MQSPIYRANGLGLLPPYLSPDFNIRRVSAKGNIEEILVTSLGDATYKGPCLILRSPSDDINIYSPYQDTSKGAKVKVLQFRKIAHSYLPKAPPEEADAATPKCPLRVITAPNGNACVFVPGHSSAIILRTASTEPTILSIRPHHLQSAAALVSPSGAGLICVSPSGNVSLNCLPLDADYSSGWSCSTILQSSAITAFSYHGASDRYVVGVGETVPYRLPEDELHPEWLNESASLWPTMEQDSIKLIDATTLVTTDTLDLEPQEVVMCIKTISLEVSEHSHQRRSVVCVGTAITRGEDINTFGCIYVLDVIEVVPEPDRPETGRKFKLLSKVRDKGAVTAITQIGTEGFLLVAQGQKCHVRGLKEDGTLLPVAFLDAQNYVNVAKELPGTGLTLLGDAMKGIWFVGYTVRFFPLFRLLISPSILLPSPIYMC
jgi:cleavage and polyadenylation specificity factor subunit 1